tara:strand:- start:635 stop:1435 length:801 start_codon:yes stop_codon:yes gene_type:complete
MIKNLNWKSTSRNTKIAVEVIEPYGEVFFKKGILLDSKNISNQIKSFKTLKKITDNIPGISSPNVIKELSRDPIIALENISGESFHSLWSKKSYEFEDIMLDIKEIYKILFYFHKTTKEMFGDYYYYKDFGPKNVMRLTEDINVLIDPPDNFIFKNPNHDFGILFFEINRSLLQTGKFQLIWQHLKIVISLLKTDKDYLIYNNYTSGINVHFCRVIKRYFLFFKKENPFKEFLRGVILVPFLITFFFSIYTMIFACKIMENNEKEQ